MLQHFGGLQARGPPTVWLWGGGSLVCTVTSQPAMSTGQNQSEEGQKRGKLKEEGWGRRRRRRVRKMETNGRGRKGGVRRREE